MTSSANSWPCLDLRSGRLVFLFDRADPVPELQLDVENTVTTGVCRDSNVSPPFVSSSSPAVKPDGWSSSGKPPHLHWMLPCDAPVRGDATFSITLRHPRHLDSSSSLHILAVMALSSYCPNRRDSLRGACVMCKSLHLSRLWSVWRSLIALNPDKPLVIHHRQSGEDCEDIPSVCARVNLP